MAATVAAEKGRVMAATAAAALSPWHFKRYDIDIQGGNTASGSNSKQHQAGEAAASSSKQE